MAYAVVGIVGRVGIVALVALCACAKEDGDGPITAEDGPIAPYDPLPFVDPMIGVGGTGAQVTGVTPAASRPFGMTLAGPDTRHSSYGAPGFYHFGGYHYDDDRIDGFSHTHSHGMGVNDFGGVHVMARARWDDAFTSGQARSAPFDHAEEWAEPGWYAVELQDDDTAVEIVATAHGAHHRYRFAPDAEPAFLVDLGHTLGSVVIDDAWAEVDLEAGRITGFQQLSGSYSARFGGLLTSFVVQLDPPPVSAGAWSDPDLPEAGAVRGEGSRSGVWVVFPEGTTEVHARVALSYVDLDGAVGNLEAELPDLDLDLRRQEAADAWREELATVRVRGGTEAEVRAFHTAQYHARLMPSLLSDVDGRYRGVDGEIHTTDLPYYSDFSLWDTFRTQHPWLTLVDPDRQRELVSSLVQMTIDGGSVPRWPLGHGYTNGMVGTPADQVFAETWLKGIDGWDVQTAWEASLAHATGPVPHAGRSGIEEYRSLGFVPFDTSGTPASNTLEYAWSDHALALLGEALGHDADAATLRAASGNWANTWDADAAFFVGRHADGTFEPLEGEFDWASSYVEGNAWHYVWYVPYDVPGMIDLQHGGDRDAFEARLRAYWDAVYAEPDDDFPDDWYWHGNEPVLHYVALGSLAGAPDVSAEAARWILAHRYGDTETGIDGNDDAGTLSAWYLWNAIGLYPVAGTTRYAVTSPLFERIEIDRPDGTLVIRAPGASTERRYVTGATLGGEPLDAAWLDHGALVGAGELVLEMGEAPSGWGRGQVAPPE